MGCRRSRASSRSTVRGRAGADGSIKAGGVNGHVDVVPARARMDRTPRSRSISCSSSYPRVRGWPVFESYQDSTRTVAPSCPRPRGCRYRFSPFSVANRTSVAPAAWFSFVVPARARMDRNWRRPDVGCGSRPRACADEPEEERKRFLCQIVAPARARMELGNATPGSDCLSFCQARARMDRCRHSAELMRHVAPARVRGWAGPLARPGSIDGCRSLRVRG